MSGSTATPVRAAFVGFGEVACALSAALAERGVRIAAYDVLLEQPEGLARLRARAGAARVEFAALPQALDGARFVFSSVTTTVARDAARACAPHLLPGQRYIDLNATDPAVKHEIDAIVGPSGATFVEAALLGAVGVTGARTEILLGGPGAECAARELASELGLNVRFYSAEIGRASTFKLLRSVFSKGLEALLLEFLVAGERAGIRADLWREATELFDKNSFDKVAANWVCTHAQAHARRHHEMVDVARMLRAIGVEPIMTAATEAVFRRSGELRMSEAFAARPDQPDSVIRFLEERTRP